MEEFERRLTASFDGTLHKYVSTMVALFHNKIKINNMKIDDTEMMLARAGTEICCNMGRALAYAWNRGGFSHWLSNFRDVEPSSLVHHCVSGFIVQCGGLSSMAHCHIAKYMHVCHGQVFHESFIFRGHTLKLDAVPILRKTFRDHIF